MKKLIRANADYKDWQPIDLDLSEMLKNPSGRKLFGKIMNTPDENVESYLQGCVDICKITNTSIPGLSEIYNSVLENGLADTMKTLRLM